MCNTVLRRQSTSGEQLNDFLDRTVARPLNNGQLPKLTVDTVQRLIGHVDSDWLTQRVIDALDEVNEQLPNPNDIDQLIAPAFRTVEDFRGCGAVVLRVLGPDNDRWRSVPNPLLDETTNRIVVPTDELHTMQVDPRSPTLWSIEDHLLIRGRLHRGQGHPDRIAEVATASIKLSLFSARPRVHDRYVAFALRCFNLTAM